jgi:flagellar basal body-associated protein FliL
MERSDHFRVTTGGRKKSWKIISAIIAGVLIAATIVALSVVFTRGNSTTTKEGIYFYEEKKIIDVVFMFD